MRVLVVHASSFQSLGGAEISLRHHIENPPPGVTVETAFPEESVELGGFDAIVLGNLRPRAVLKGGAGGAVKSRVREWLIRSPFHELAFRAELAWVRLWCRKLSGYTGYVVKSERDVHPCARRDGRCVLTDPVVTRTSCHCGGTVRAAFQCLYNLCDAVQFLSPLHQKAINQLVDIEVPQFVIAPPLDFTRFRSEVPADRRKRAALILGDAIRVGPNAEALARQNGYEPARLDYLSVPFDCMPALLNEYQAVVLDPLMLHAFGRLAAEALACGCRVLATSRVGAMSWPDPLAACRESNTRFWEMVTSAPDWRNPRRCPAWGRSNPEVSPCGAGVSE